jgi:uncharacterized protein (DUF2147 family)
VVLLKDFHVDIRLQEAQEWPTGEVVCGNCVIGENYFETSHQLYSKSNRMTRNKWENRMYDGSRNKHYYTRISENYKAFCI